ncbi:MAG: AAA family ATPase [Clostridiales bacterium]|nr:AAA family ATPase [Clostridiales bacterium]
MNGQLSKIVIRGFKSIKGCELDLKNINVLVGANGAGKSNFISIFEMLGKVLARELSFYVQRKGINPLLYNGKEVTDSIFAKFDYGALVYSFDLEWTEQDSLYFRDEQLTMEGKTILGEGGFSESRAINAIRNAKVHEAIPKGVLIPNWRVYQFHNTSPSSRIKAENNIADCETLLHDASNLAAFLYRLQENYPDEYKKTLRAVHRIAPYFKDFDLKPKEQNNEQIVLRWKQKDYDGVLMPSQLSDGTLRFICLATLLLQPEELQPSIIVIDEPELGLHPYAMTIFAELVKKTASKKQVILATQSTELLDHFEAEDVIVVDRTENGSEFNRLDAEKLAAWLDKLTAWAKEGTQP